jgi:hypothetical protein
MAFVAPCFQIIEIESQVRSLLDRDLMVGMKVPVTSSECSAQFFQHLLCWRTAESNFAPDSEKLWLPAAINALPLVPEET